MLCYTISLPRKTSWEDLRAEQLIDQLLFSFDTLVFRIVSSDQSMKWQIIDLEEREQEVIITAIRANYPTAQITVEVLDTSSTVPNRTSRFVCNYRYRTPIFPIPMLYVDDITTPDPLATLTQAMSSLQAGEQVIYTLAVMGYAMDTEKKGQELITVPNNEGFGRRKPRYEHHLQVAAEEKLTMPLYDCLMFIQFDSSLGGERVQELIEIEGQLVHYTRSEMGGIMSYEGYKPVNLEAGDQEFSSSSLGIYQSILEREDDIAAIRNERNVLEKLAVFLLPFLDEKDQFAPGVQMKLVPKEIAALWHLPHAGFSASSIDWQRSAQVDLPRSIKGKQEGILLGINQYLGHEESVRISNADRATHIAVIGKAGTGKSTLLHHMIAQDIQRNSGVAVIDPHGQLVRDILRTSIPPEREKDVVVIDLADEAFPPPLNLLALPTGVDNNSRNTIAGRLISILDKQGSFADTVTVAPTLRAALLTLWNEQTPTIRDIIRLFNDEDYRNKLVDKADNPAVEDFWMSYLSKKAGQQEQVASPIVQRMSDFYSNEILYPVMCHPDILDFASLIRQKKIVLVSLEVDGGKVPPPEQRLLGAILLSQLQAAIMNRAVEQGSYYLYIDEVQHFITTSLDEMFSEVRKYNLSLIVANQYLKQLAGNTLDAIMGTVGALIAFQCGLDDARSIAPYMKPNFDADNLIALDLHQAAVFMRSNKTTVPAFNLATLKPLASKTPSTEELEREARIREFSHQLYTPKTREEVLTWLRNRYPKRGRNGQDANEVLVDPKN